MTPPHPPLSAADVRRSLTSPHAFAEILTGAPLWPWQAEVAASDARYRCILAGRRAGKSRLLAVLALHTAFTRPGASVVIVSVGEVASLRVLADVAALCRGPLLAGSVVDELKSVVTLTNGSRIESYPASMRQIRGVGADLLIVDEAAFVPRDIWSAAYPSVADRVRAGARVILASTPWPIADSWFREWHQRGLDGDPAVASWWCPSDVNPNIGPGELADMRAGMSAEEYEREIEAKWTSEQGAYFTAEELEAATADYVMSAPGDWRALGMGADAVAVAGLDFGFRVDANAVCLVSLLDDGNANPRRVFYVPYVEAWHGLAYHEFVTRLLELGRWYHVAAYVAETNGCGEAPSQELQRRLIEESLPSNVAKVWTDARRKQAGFSKIKSLMASGELVIPRDVDLLRELRSLEFERTESGMLRVAARAGYHDDRAMSLLQAVSCVEPGANPDHTVWAAGDLGGDRLVLGNGAVVPATPRPARGTYRGIRLPEGMEPARSTAW